MPRELAHPELIDDPVRRAEMKAKLAEVAFPQLLAIDLSPQALEIHLH